MLAYRGREEPWMSSVVVESLRRAKIRKECLEMNNRQYYGRDREQDLVQR